MTPERAEQTASTVNYRCVCGNDATVHLIDGGQCSKCKRDISADMLRSNVSQTIEIPSLGSISSEVLTQQASLQVEEDLTGETLGHYKIIRSLGHGGMGSVYQALDESLQRYVALKVLKRVDRDSPELDQLMQEARAQARVNHPNVVHIYYVSGNEQYPFLAMELVNGPSLAIRMRQRKLAYDEIVRIAIETARALNQSARFDIVHGDIKPANILLTENHLVKLSDFGLSRRISESKGEAQRISGTPAYMAPEVTRGSEPTIFSDQYSLGVMLFQLTFGRPPYTVKQDSVTDMIDAHQQASVEFPRPWPKDLPDEWKHVLLRLLAKDPKARFGSYNELIRTLHQAKPLDLPKAGIVVRSVAWTLDILLALGLFGITQLPLQLRFVENLLKDRPFLTALGALPLFFAPLGSALFQTRWKNSPAKKLMQICIVDEHGLKPGSGILFSRAIFQLAPVWAACLFAYLERLEIDIGNLDGIFSGLYSIFIVVSVGMLIFSKTKRTLHDRIFGTRVCLDAGSTEVKE